MTREEHMVYVKECFEKYFLTIQQRKLVIYGTSFKSEVILKEFQDCNIIGVINDYSEEKFFEGKPMISLEEAISMQADCIIVVAGAASTKKIYKKIIDKCLESHIEIYNIYGKNLEELYGVGNLLLADEQYFKVNKQQLKDAIACHDIISFDVFDTLIMRKTYTPKDVFEIVSYKARIHGLDIMDFQKKRIQAERDILDRNPNIYEIYEYIQTILSLTDSQKQDLIRWEIEAEKSLLISRRDMVEVLEYACSIGKKVYLISDMYLPREIIKTILEDLQIITGVDILVSCDRKSTKYTGLYRIFQDEVHGSNYLHIGDNEDADGYCARMEGMDVFIIKSAADMLKMSSYREIVEEIKSINDSSLVGLFIAKAFNSPFALFETKGKYILNTVEELGYLYVGGLITSFILWLAEQLEYSNFNKILFSARDGYLIHKLYNYLSNKGFYDKLPEGKYLLTSRNACIVSTVETEKDIVERAAAPFSSTPEQMLHMRFALKKEDIKPYQEDTYEDIVSYTLSHKENIFAASYKNKKNYQRYLADIGVTKGYKYAMFDFVSSGTCQYLLGKIMDIEIEGKYFCRYRSEGFMQEKEQLIIDSYYKNGYHCEVGSRFFDNYLFLETVMTSTQPTLKRFDKNGKPIYANDPRSSLQLQYVTEMHEAITDYFIDYIDHLYIPKVEINQVIGDMSYGFKDSLFTQFNCRILDELVLTDHMAQEKIPVRYS